MREHPKGAWNWLFNSRVEHWFQDSDSRSLCGRYGLFGRPPEHDQTNNSKECKGCRTKLDKLKAQL